MALAGLLVAAGRTSPTENAAGPSDAPTPTPPAPTGPGGAAGLKVEVRDDLVEVFRDVGIDGASRSCPDG